MIGSGVFLLPASLASFGSISIGGWVVTAIGAMMLAIVFGRLARVLPKTGGPYAYTRAGFGEFPGFLIAWGYWIALWAGNAGVAVAFAGYVGHFLPQVASGLPELAVALGALWLVTLINMRGVGEAGMVQIITTLLKILPLLALALFGMFAIEPHYFTPFNASGRPAISALAACAALTLWAFLGLESATVPAGNVRDPERTIARATILGTSFAAILYIIVTVVVLGTVPRSSVVASTAPLALAADHLWGPLGAALIAVGAIVSTFGTLNGFTLLAGQVPFGAARDGAFPGWFGTEGANGSPTNALLASGVLASALIAMNFSKGLVDQFTFIILLATFTSLVPYAFCALAELAIYARNPTTYQRPKRLGRVVALSAAAFVYSAGAIYGAGPEVVFWGFLLLLLSVPLFVWLKLLPTDELTTTVTRQAVGRPANQGLTI
jgi:amino acid transporter